MFKRKKISFRETLLTKKKPDFFHSVYYQLTSYSIFYSKKMFLKYATLGLVGTLVHLIILVILTELGIFYLYSAGVGIIAGIYANYLLNKKYIVKERTHNQKKASTLFSVLYFGVSIITIFVNLWLLVVFVETYNVGYLLANIVSSFLMFLTRYLFHRVLFSNFGH